MALRISWSKKAGIRFDEIVQYLESGYGFRVANDFVTNIYHTLDILSILPELGSIENKYLNIRGLVVVQQITLFYQVRQDRIILLNFYDNRQKPKDSRY
jgi:plasmid stabilization system protein ParE